MNLALPGNAEKSGAFLLTLLAAAAISSPAATVYTTGFESPMTPGSGLVGQDGWVAGAPFLSPAAPVIVSGVAQSGSQSVRVLGSQMQNAVEVGPDLAAVGSYRRPLNYDTVAAGLPVITITTAVRLDGKVLNTGDFFAANIAARSGDGAVGELGISSDGVVYGYSGNFGGVSLFSTPITLGEWHTLGISVDFSKDTYSFSVDGTSFGSYPFEAGFTSDMLLRTALVTYAKPDGGAFARSDFTAYFDQVSVTSSVPEPSALHALFAAGAAMVFKRRRRRAA